jgi:hypothetical protein
MFGYRRIWLKVAGFRGGLLALEGRFFATVFEAPIMNQDVKATIRDLGWYSTEQALMYQGSTNNPRQQVRTCEL